MDRARQVYDEMQAAGAARGPLEALPHHSQQAPGDDGNPGCPPAPSPRFPGYLDGFGRKQVRFNKSQQYAHSIPTPKHLILARLKENDRPKTRIG